MSDRFLWDISELRQRVRGGALGEPGRPTADKRFEQTIWPPSVPARESSRGTWHPDWAPDDVRSPAGLRPGFVLRQEKLDGAGRLNPMASPLDDLVRELDRHQNGAAESGRAAIEALMISMASRRGPRRSQDPDRGPRAYIEVERDQQFVAARDQWTASNERDALRSSADRFSISAFDQIAMARRAGQVDTGALRSTVVPFSSAGLEAVSPIFKRELSYGAPYLDRVTDDAVGPIERPSGFEQKEEADATEHLDSIARRLEELARELDERESDATDAEIAAFKHRLDALAREIDLQCTSETATGGTDEYRSPYARQLERFAGETVNRDDFAAVGGFGPPATSLDQRRNEAIVAGLTAINALVNSMAPRRDTHQSNMPSRVLRDCTETGSLERDGQFPERWIASQSREGDQTELPDDPFVVSASDRVLPPISSGGRASSENKRALRSTMAPFVKAVLAAALAITVVVAGTYFVRSRLPGAAAATLMAAIFKENASAGEASASESLRIADQNTLARFQEQTFQLPNLYGIYAINGGKLFELEALPGQVPDRRVPVSAVIPQPSRTTLPDGRIAFLVFRRDVATNISERVPIRVVAKIRRISEPRSAGEDAWTIRNVAFDFRVAPVVQNREMVLLQPEDSGFIFPAGRYALTLKGQAYDFTVAGQITDPAQCLERVEAANGSFLHECQQPEAGTAGPSLHKSAPPQRSRLSSRF